MSIEINERARKITVTIDGEDYGLLERTARAINACSWSDNDNTALTVFRAFAWPWTRDFFLEAGSLAGTILDGIATDDEGLFSAPSPLHEERIAELKAAFEAEGLLEKRA